MPYRISGLDDRPVPVSAGSPVARGRDSATPDARGGSSAAVHITDAASQLAALEQALKDLPAVDEARVAEIRRAIDEGRYTVQPDRIADQLLQLERALRGLDAER